MPSSSAALLQPNQIHRLLISWCTHCAAWANVLCIARSDAARPPPLAAAIAAASAVGLVAPMLLRLPSRLPREAAAASIAASCSSWLASSASCREQAWE